MFDFGTAMKRVTDGKKVARKEWNNDDCVYMHADRLHLRKTDGSMHQLVLCQADLSGLDWFIVNEH